MDIVFYIAGGVATAATLLVITRLNAVHALLYMVVALLSVAVVFFSLGATFVAALEVIVYAGAVMVLFIFVVMMLDLGGRAVDEERGLLSGGMWIGPGILAAILLGEVLYAIGTLPSAATSSAEMSPAQVGELLYSAYVLAAELASMLLLAGLVSAYHLARPARRAAWPQGRT